jgi:hypothetical protein
VRIARWGRLLPLVAAAAVVISPVVGLGPRALGAAPRPADALAGAGRPIPRPPSRAVPRSTSAPMVVLTSEVRAAMDSIFRDSNQHWDELVEESQLAQMLGTGKPTQLEYMGCLTGHVMGDSVWVDGTTPARDMKRFQFAVTGECDHVAGLVGTWHTHPYRAALDGRAIKTRELSTTDLATFAAGADRAVLGAGDSDSIPDGGRPVKGAARHPAGLVLRGAPTP